MTLDRASPAPPGGPARRQRASPVRRPHLGRDQVSVVSPAGTAPGAGGSAPPAGRPALDGRPRRSEGVDDTLGHRRRRPPPAAGAASRAPRHGSDTAYRLGGDEFAVLLPGASRDQAQRLTDRVAEARRACPAAGAWPPARPTEVVAEGLTSAADARLYRRRARARREAARSEAARGKQFGPSRSRGRSDDGSGSLAWSGWPEPLPSPLSSSPPWRSSRAACGSDDKPSDAASRRRPAR